MATDPNTSKIVGLLVEVAKGDTVYRDIHLRRARQLFSTTFDEASYRAIGTTEKEIEDLTRGSRTAVLHREWARAAEVSARIENLRQRLASTRNLAVMGKEVYDADPVVFEPFSPGKHLGAQAQASQADLRSRLTDAFASLAKLDSAASAFYEKRRSYFAGLELKSEIVSQKGPQRDRSHVERLAMEAAERGDAAALQRLAKELHEWQQSGAGPAAANAPVVLSRYECPIDLSAPFPSQAIETARDFGLVEGRTAPVAELAKVREAIYTHADQPVPSNPDMEREGVLRSRALAELGLPAELDSEDTRVLAGQFIQQIFVNSAGVRYLPTMTAETVLWEDFAENEAAADRPSNLLAALGLPHRNGCSHAEIESALMHRGAEIIETMLGLDPLEFRLVCIPYDLYARFGRERGFGQWPHWTHLDGYQVMAGNRLRALAGGDSRFGGLYDLVSISPSDTHEGIYARFAVVRRARQTLRWR
ncbi:MAG TPA: hypothetical protein VFK65_10980 [Candidatus Binatia bacterium]|nr:hypothetical protein [Candidatus Binatia bacterium]